MFYFWHFDLSNIAALCTLGELNTNELHPSVVGGLWDSSPLMLSYGPLSEEAEICAFSSLTVTQNVWNPGSPAQEGRELSQRPLVVRALDLHREQDGSRCDEGPTCSAPIPSSSKSFCKCWGQFPAFSSVHELKKAFGSELKRLQDQKHVQMLWAGAPTPTL